MVGLRAKRLVAISSLVFAVLALARVTGIVGRADSSAATSTSQAAATVETAVRTVPSGQRMGAALGQKGATYYWLEGQTARITTRYRDATAVAERSPDGDLNSRVTDASGNEVARFKVDRIDDTSHVLQFLPQRGAVVQALGEATLKPTLDWTNRQAYALSSDAASPGSGLVWRDGVVRRQGSPARDLEREILELHTEWAGGLSAKAVRKSGVRHQLYAGRMLQGEVVVTHLRRDGVEVGTGNWFPRERVFVWDIPGLTRGYLDGAALAEMGGWRFEPDIHWVNLQTIAFYHFKTLIDTRGFVAQRQPRQRGGLRRVLDFFEPTVRANEEGCDDLHWLDGTIYRFCCDSHDLCYTKYGCSAQSWWQIWSSWSCDVCNLWTVSCFVSGAGAHRGFLPYPG